MKSTNRAVIEWRPRFWWTSPSRGVPQTSWRGVSSPAKTRNATKQNKTNQTTIAVKMLALGVKTHTAGVAFKQPSHGRVAGQLQHGLTWEKERLGILTLSQNPTEPLTLAWNTPPLKPYPASPHILAWQKHVSIININRKEKPQSALRLISTVRPLA